MPDSLNGSTASRCGASRCRAPGVFMSYNTNGTGTNFVSSLIASIPPPIASPRHERIRVSDFHRGGAPCSTPRRS
jgi:hypothetical protein